MDVFQLWGWFWQLALWWTPKYYAFVWVVALFCSRYTPKIQRQSEHLITHNARLSRIILHDCKHRINSMERNCLLAGCPDAAQWNTRYLRDRTTAETSTYQSRVWQVLRREARLGVAVNEWRHTFDVTVVVAEHISTCFSTAVEAAPATPAYNETPVCRCESANRGGYRSAAERGNGWERLSHTTRWWDTREKCSSMLVSGEAEGTA